MEFDPLTGEHKNVVRHVAIFPASHYIVGPEKMQEGLKKIQAEMEEQVKKFTEEGKLLEAQRIQQRTNYDMEMLQEVGMCKGIENYSAVLSGRAPGSTPTTLLDYFPDDFLETRPPVWLLPPCGAKSAPRRPDARRAVWAGSAGSGSGIPG